MRTGAACFGFAARSVLALSDGVVSACCFDRPKSLPNSPAMVVGWCAAGVSPCFGCGAGRGNGTLATTTGSLGSATGSDRTGASAALAAGGVTGATGAAVVVRGNAPGALATRGSAPGALVLALLLAN